MRKDEAQAQLSKQQYDVRQVIGPKTTPYMFWKRWSAACGRNEFGLVYDMLLPGGELAEKFRTAEDFFVNLVEIGLPYEDRWTLDGLRINAGTIEFLCHRADSNDRNADIVCSLMTIKMTELGFRVEKIEKCVCNPKDGGKVNFDLFERKSLYGAYLAKLATGWTRPDLTDESTRFVPPAD